jgi:hypothetical protein
MCTSGRGAIETHASSQLCVVQLRRLAAGSLPGAPDSQQKAQPTSSEPKAQCGQGHAVARRPLDMRKLGPSQRQIGGAGV